mmetsp:Transcript_48576/g.105367  ORF Transcript_48576/g.105367 Transcript_48576/m.105367 type:complete len:348 (-) Transcript_48576:28-1071(-)
MKCDRTGNNVGWHVRLSLFAAWKYKAQFRFPAEMCGIFADLGGKVISFQDEADRSHVDAREPVYPYHWRNFHPTERNPPWTGFWHDLVAELSPSNRRTWLVAQSLVLNNVKPYLRVTETRLKLGYNDLVFHVRGGDIMLEFGKGIHAGHRKGGYTSGPFRYMLANYFQPPLAVLLAVLQQHQQEIAPQTEFKIVVVTEKHKGNPVIAGLQERFGDQVVIQTSSLEEDQSLLLSAHHIAYGRSSFGYTYSLLSNATTVYGMMTLSKRTLSGSIAMQPVNPTQKVFTLHAPSYLEFLRRQGGWQATPEQKKNMQTWDGEVQIDCDAMDMSRCEVVTRRWVNLTGTPWFT